MRILDGYVNRMAIGGYALAISVLLTLFGFIVFLEQLEDVGDGSYDTLDAALYVLLTLPALLMRLAPVGALLGGLLAAASLARNSELIAIRSAGVSSLRLSWSFLRPALAFVILLVVVGEYIAPPLQQAAERGRSIQVTDVNDVLRGKGLWSRDGLRFLYVRALRHGQIPAGIDLYEFDPSGQLRRYLHAEQADVLADGAWRLRNVRQKRTVDGTPSNQWLAELHWQPFWSSDQMKVLQLPADSLSYTKLLDYRAYLHSTGQTTERADLLFWQKVAAPLSAAAMALLAVPFGFGSQRSPGMVRQIALGALIGVSFHLLGEVAGSAGLLLNLNAPVVALSPSVLVIVTALLLTARKR